MVLFTSMIINRQHGKIFIVLKSLELFSLMKAETTQKEFFKNIVNF